MSVKVRVADMALARVDLTKPETMTGIGIGLVKIAPLILAAEAVVDAYEKAREREQEIRPTRVRLAIAMLRSEMASVYRNAGVPAQEGDSTK